MLKKIWYILLVLLLIPAVCVATIRVVSSSLDAQKTAITEPIILELSEQPTKAEVASYIAKKATQEGVDADTMLRIAKCESGYNYLAKNSNSTASGVYQFLNSTWLNTRVQMGVDKSSVFNAKDNIDTAIWKVKNGGIKAWDASFKCWN